MKIIVHIDRLILEGVAVAPQERALLQATIEAELGRLLAEGGIGANLLAGGAVPSLAGGALPAGVDQSPGALGAGIAQAVYAGIGDQGPGVTGAGGGEGGA